MNLIKHLLISSRPHQWIKNLVIFAAPLFGSAIDIIVWSKSLGVFFLFCVLSSSTYLVNDSVDRKEDRLHPKKKNRPIAKGDLSVFSALLFAGLGLLVTIAGGYLIEPKLIYPFLLYMLLQVCYNNGVKNIPVLDILVIAVGFIIRAWSGGIATGIPLSLWLIITVGFLALFLGTEKRKSELRSMPDSVSRKVLENYTLPWLTQMSTVMLSVTILCYSLWAIEADENRLMVITIPIVVYGLLTYQKKSEEEISGEQPEKLIIKSPAILLAVFIWILVALTVRLFW